MESESHGEVLRASPALFASRRLDRLTRVRPVVPPLIYGPLITLLLVLGLLRLPVWEVVAFAAGGYGVWTLTEYWVHRSLFHLTPKRPLGERVHFVIHGVHHDHPNDPMRLVMPPVVSVPAAVVFLAIFDLALGRPDAYPLAAGFIAGYLAYDVLHYRLHHRRPKTRLFRALHQRHMRHHFQDDSTAYGVSAPYWDAVFHTAPRHHARPAQAQPRRSRARSGEARRRRAARR